MSRWIEMKNLPKLNKHTSIIRTEIITILNPNGETVDNQWAVETVRDNKENETRIMLTPLGSGWSAISGDIPRLSGPIMEIPFNEARAVAVGLLRAIYHEMPQTWYLAEGDPQEYLAHLLETIYDLTPRAREHSDRRDGIKNLLAMQDAFKRAMAQIGKAKAKALQWRKRYVHAAKWARTNHRKVIAQRRDIRGMRKKLAKMDSYHRLLDIERAAMLYLEHGEPELADELEALLKNEKATR
jgi:hypothetical protein